MFVDIGAVHELSQMTSDAMTPWMLARSNSSGLCSQAHLARYGVSLLWADFGSNLAMVIHDIKQ